MNGAGIDLNLFQFDYDLTWAAFFMNAHGHVYARYGARKDAHAEAMMSLAGLRTVMTRALEAHRRDPDRRPPATAEPLRPESFRSLPENLRSGKNCMHCHQVWDFQRRDLPAFSNAGATAVYPLPENLGFSLEVDRGNIVASVDPEGPAARAGLRAKDEVLAMNGTPVWSAADASWVLHNHSGGSPVLVDVQRAGARQQVKVVPQGDWRSRDISWRGSMWALRPATGFGGKRLDDAELQKLGLKAGTFAVRVNYIVDWDGADHPAGRNALKAGLRKGDVVLAAGGKRDFSGEMQFQTWFRLTQKPGTEIEIEILRDGKVVKLRIPIM